jgi:NAD(P)-dependent dehydrogenase (short-subunit alcohol dehydrogenase family)
MARGLSSIPAPRVRVNCVTPGITMTPMGQDTINALEQDYTKNRILFRRYATPEEIALYRLFSQPGKKLPDRRRWMSTEGANGVSPGFLFCSEFS